MVRLTAPPYSTTTDNPATPKYPIVLAHGLLGFSELRLAPLPTIHYWHGIKDALTAQGAVVVTASVPPSSSIAHRAAKLAADIDAADLPANTPVNVIAHSMGGLDARYMISRTSELRTRVASLVTISTPHRGSPFADYVLDAATAGPLYLPRLYWLLERGGFGTSAFAQLTTRYMADDFNLTTPDDADVRYFSYGAAMRRRPPLLSPFRLPAKVIAAREGPNDGLVSVDSSRWGEYQGTLVGVNHLDLINWPNRLRYTVKRWMGKTEFNAVAFYLGVADMLAREGL